MALTDPQTITLAGAQSLPRTGVGPADSTYTKADGSLRLNVSHSYGKRTRHVVRVQTAKISVDPLVTTMNIRLSASVTVTVDAPPQGYTTTELVDQIVSACTWLTATTNANATKLVGGES